MSNSVVTHILAKKKEENKDVTRRFKGYLRRERSEVDTRLQEMLSGYSVEQVKSLLTEVIENKDLPKKEKTYIVAHISHNQPHAINKFQEFYDWNKDLWQGRGLGPMTALMGALLGSLLGGMIGTAIGSELEAFISGITFCALMGGWALYSIVKGQRMLFIDPRFVYEDRLDQPLLPLEAHGTTTPVEISKEAVGNE